MRLFRIQTGETEELNRQFDRIQQQLDSNVAALTALAKATGTPNIVPVFPKLPPSTGTVLAWGYDSDSSGDSEPNIPGPGGKDGLPGRPGPPGLDGQDGEDGSPGLPGSPGNDGLSIVGPAAGADGDDGMDGFPGVPGRSGIDGRQGPPGMDGQDGQDGQDGAPGAIGATGASGVDGAPGLAGPAIGSDGDDGMDGFPGTRGLDGLRGLRGPPGADGQDGEDGAPGVVGATGPAGTNGTNGTNGATGATGATGPVGPSLTNVSGFLNSVFFGPSSLGAQGLVAYMTGSIFGYYPSSTARPICFPVARVVHNATAYFLIDQLIMIMVGETVDLIVFQDNGTASTVVNIPDGTTGLVSVSLTGTFGPNTSFGVAIQGHNTGGGHITGTWNLIMES